MADEPWKVEERKVAAMFGSKRKLMKGTKEKEDTDNETFCIDTKVRKRWDVRRWYSELKLVAETRGKIAVLTLRRPGKGLRFAAVDAELGRKICDHFGPELFDLAERTNTSWSIDLWFREHRKVARARNKIPILRLNHPQEDSTVVIMDCSNLVSALKGMGLLRNQHYEGGEPA